MNSDLPLSFGVPRFPQKRCKRISHCTQTAHGISQALESQAQSLPPIIGSTNINMHSGGECIEDAKAAVTVRSLAPALVKAKAGIKISSRQ
jgi:hypothetical protein